MTDRDDLVLIGAWMQERGDHPLPPDLLAGARRRILAEDAARAGRRAPTHRWLWTGLGLAAGIAVLTVALSAVLPIGRRPPDPLAPTLVGGPLLAVETQASALVLQPVEADGRPVAGRHRLEIGHHHERVQSPDGRTLAIFSFPGDDSAGGDLLLVDLASWTWTQAPFQVPSDLAAPTWTADSRTLAWFEPQTRIERYSLPRDYQLMRWTIGSEAPVSGPTLSKEFVPQQARPAGPEGVLVYGQPVNELYLESGVPEVMRIDLEAGTIAERVELVGVVAGQDERPGDPGTYTSNTPGIAWDLPRDRLLVAGPDLLTTVHWGDGGLSVNSRLIAAPTSLLDAVVAWLVPAAAAKMPLEGTTLAATLSPDGSRIYLTGTVVDHSDAGAVLRPLGLRVVDASDGTLLADLDAPIDEVALAPDGTRLVASGRTETYPADVEGLSDVVAADLLVLDAADLHELERIPAPDGVGQRTPIGFTADGGQAYVLTYRPSETWLPTVQLLDLATGDLTDGHFDPDTMELLPLRP